MADRVMNPVSEDQMRLDLSESKGLQSTAASTGGPNDAMLKVASVTRVDHKRMSVDLMTVTGKALPYKNVPLTFGSAGARTFCGALPEVQDQCVIGFAPKESGFSRQPFIVGWLVPGTQVGYDWVPERPGSYAEQPSGKAMDDRLEGMFRHRRHKLHNMGPGNAFVSSSQGADLVLDESATLINRRGNEVVLRDQDQALVIRSLQQFHAGAGFRVYAGMVQRDSTLLPTQMFGDGTDWTSYGQVYADGTAVPSPELGEGPEDGILDPATIFARDPETGDLTGGQGLVDPNLDPFNLLQRGLYVDEQGGVFDDKVRPTAVYGGKPLYRVSVDGWDSRANAATANIPTFTEYRIEVAHTSDGTLPVTEQTDGIDVNRMPDAPPTVGSATNTATDTPFVELVMGTVVGNDPLGGRDQYGVPLKAEVYRDGVFSPKITALGGPEANINDQLAFMIRVKNPSDPKAPPAFWGITKGGALKSYFPGKGSETTQEHYQTGKKLHLGTSETGDSFVVEAEGVCSVINESVGRQSDNVGAEMVAKQAALYLYGGGALLNPTSPGETDVGGPVPAVHIKSGLDTLIEAPNGNAYVRAPNISLDNASTIRQTASSKVAIDSGDSLGLSANDYALQVNGAAKQTFGGPKNGLATSGPLLDTKFTGTPATGLLGGSVDEQLIVYGGRSEQQYLGKRNATVLAGGFEIRCMTPTPSPQLGPESSASLNCGPWQVENKVEAGLDGVGMAATFGAATISALVGLSTLQGTLGVNAISPARIGMQAPLVAVNAPGLPGGVLTDGCIDNLTGLPFLASGTIGAPGFRLGG
jgi:hypothetical protein